MRFPHDFTPLKLNLVCCKLKRRKKKLLLDFSKIKQGFSKIKQRFKK